MRPDRNPLLSYDSEERIRQALAASTATDGLQAPARVEAALLAGLRQRRRRALAVRITSAAAIAAAVLIGLWSTLPSAPVPQIPAPPTVAQQTPAPIAQQPVQVAAAKPATAPAPRRTATQRRPVQRPAPAPEADFIPVGAWQAYEPMERGAIVRVRLPKSSLPGFGIPVSADRWNESFPADVVLGEDGTMRAIRFVSSVQ